MVQAIPSSLQLRYHLPHSTYSEGKYNYFKPLPFKCSVHSSTKNANNIRKGYYFVDSIHSKYMQGSIERRKQRLRIKPALKSSVYKSTTTHDLDEINCSSSRHRTHRRIHFSKTNDVRILPEKTSEDKFHSWYSKNDYAKFESDRKRTVHKLQQMYQSSSNDTSTEHYHLDPNEYTVVGVEHYIYGREQIMLRKLHSLRHTRSVLQQQQYNKDYQHENYYSYTPYNNNNNMDYNNNMSYCCTNYHNNFDESLRYVSQLYSTQSMMNGRSCHDMLQPLQV